MSFVRKQWGIRVFAQLSKRQKTRRTVSVISSVSAVALGLTLLTATPTIAATAKPTPDLGKPVTVRSVQPQTASKTPSSSRSVGAAASNLPAPGNFTLTTPSSPVKTPLSVTLGGHMAATLVGGWQELGSTGISVAPATGTQNPASKSATAQRGDPVTSLSASVVDPITAKRFGLRGLVLKLQRTDGSSSTAPLAVRVPNSLLAGMFGADFASRVRWVQLPAAVAKASSAKTAAASPVAATFDSASKSTLVSPQVSSSAVMLAPMAGPVSGTGTGSFTATSLKPASTWDVSAQTGDFSWSYPLRVPPAAAGPAPAVAFTYDSQSVDGETGSTNNQPSAVGEGWNVSGTGFIERTYVPCSQDTGASGPVTTSGDLCWKTDNATMSFGGHSGQLVKDTTSGVWKLQGDDGSRVEHLVGAAQGCASNGTYDNDCWRLTTRDGTQYFFGLNQLPGWTTGKPVTNSTWTVPVFGNDPGEPCNTGTFATSSCTQAWRWNLDYVVDTHNNAEAFYYNAETNNYAKNGITATSYVRGGQLEHIDYGLTAAGVYAANAASGQVLFGYDAYGRCSDATHTNCSTEPVSGNAAAPSHPTSYPDVPFDQNCTSGACTNLLSPTFWTTAMLSTVTTRVLQSGAYANVDVWSLGHSFPDPGDSTNAALWLTKIDHTGYAGGAALSDPTTTFTGATLQNRVWVIDGLAPLDKYRITSLHTATGAVISVNYSAQECTPAGAAAIEASPQTNTARCFPQWWSPQVTPPQPAQEDLFHKYVVTSVIANPETGGGNDATQETDYVYTGTPAWRYDTSPLIPEGKRTWSVFAGYNTVEIRVGGSNTPAAQQTTDYTFYQGMDGDRAAPAGGSKSVSVTGAPGTADSLWFAGRTRETKTLNGVGGAVLSDTISTPWASAVSANDGTNTARMIGDADVTEATPIAAGGNRSVETVTTHDATYGLPVTVDTITSDAGTTCTTTAYAAANTSAWIIGAPKETAKVGVDCANVATATYPAAAISDTRSSYDGLAWGAAPARGDVTESDVVDSYTGSTAATAHWTTAAKTSYDTMGRPLTVTDVLGHTSSTAYTPAAGAPAGSGALTTTTVTNTAPFNWTTTTTYDPAWGAETSVADQNGKLTSASYDALGRRVGVWLPNHPQATNTQPSTAYAYTVSQTAANAVATTTLTGNAVVTSYTLYDGLGQPVQTQASAEGGGTVATDTAYDSAGRVAWTNGAYWAASVNPSATLFVPVSEQNIGSQTVTTYDGAGRTLATILNTYGTERYRTTNAYLGVDRVDTTPPTGGTPTSLFTNTLGQKTKLVQYLAATPGGAAQETTTYGHNAQGSLTSMVDPAGNQWSWGFDVLGHQTSAVDPDTGTTTSSFDDAGNLLTATDARGVTLAYSYDNLNRKIGEYSGSTSGALLASWTYDTIAKGQLTSSSSYTGSTPGTPGNAYTFAVTGYDNGYQPTGTTVSIPAGAPGFGGTSYTNTLYYNADESPAAIVYPAEGGLSSERLRYSYDSLGKLGGLFGAQSYGTAVYTAIGQIAQYNRISTASLYSTFGYDPGNGAITEIKDTSNVSSTYTTQADRVYGRNDSGDVTKIATTGAAGADTQCFGYDYLHELTQAWTPTTGDCTVAPTSTGIGGAAPYWTSYAIDPATGNRTQVTQNPTSRTGTATTDTYAYPAGGAPHPHAVQTVTHSGTATTDTYGYDADGNTTTRPGQALTYDATGKLSAVAVGAASQTSIYDANGTLLLQSDPTNGTTLYLGDTELHVAAGSSTATAVRTYTLAGAPVAERTTRSGVSGSTVTWISGDANHTQDLEIAATSGAVTRRFVDPYGNTRGTAATWSSTHGYLNAPTDSFASLAQLGARPYDPTTGKFMSVDSVLAPGNPLQNNGYAYAGNSPVSDADPSGYCYSTPTDSLNFHTNCVGSTGSAAGNGAAYVPHGVPLAPGNSSSDYGIYHAVTTAPIVGDTSGGANDSGDESFVSKLERVGKAHYYDTPGATPYYSAWAVEANRIANQAGALLFIGAALGVCTVLTDGLCLGAAPEAVGGALGAGEADALAGGASLEARTSELHGLLDPIAQNSRTTAVLETDEGKSVVASGGRDLSPIQRDALGPDEVAAKEPMTHAEVTAINEANKLGLTPRGIAASRPFCPACQGFLEESGATITSPTTAWWLLNGGTP